MSESKSVSQTQVRESADISIEILSSVELHQALVYLLCAVMSYSTTIFKLILHRLPSADIKVNNGFWLSMISFNLLLNTWRD